MVLLPSLQTVLETDSNPNFNINLYAHHLSRMKSFGLVHERQLAIVSHLVQLNFFPISQLARHNVASEHASPGKNKILRILSVLPSVCLQADWFLNDGGSNRVGIRAASGLDVSSQINGEDA